LTEEDKDDWEIFRNLRPHLQIGPHFRKLFSGIPQARKPFISSADLGKFVDEKSRQEIHTLDEFAAFTGSLGDWRIDWPRKKGSVRWTQ